jgi:hypothetical protein
MILPPGFYPIINACSLSRVEPQKDCDMLVVYGAMDGPGDLNKDMVAICV